MIDFPASTAVHRRMPKESFYQHLPLTTAQKEKFVSDVDRIYVENSLTRESLHLTAEATVQEIMLLSVTLKKQEFDGKVLELIARQNPHALVFLLIYDDLRQLAVYRGKLYRTEWMEESDLTLQLKGYSLDEIWDSLVEQIALSEEQAEPCEELSIEERLARRERIEKLEKLIAKTQAAAWREVQPKKKFDLHTRLQAYQRELEELRHG